MNKLLLLISIIFISSCSSIKNTNLKNSSYESLSKSKTTSISLIKEKELENKSIIQVVDEKNSSVVKEKYFRDKHEFNIYRNKYVDKWIEYFSKKDRKRFLSFLNKGAYYKEVIQTILEEEELPYILYYLPLIESGFNYKAHSHAGAVGPWQFIKGTGKRYGLAINSLVDERRDPILSTESATKYLNDLYNVFNSWELAIAAYNCGEIRVLRAIMKGKTRDFWELSRRKLLPRETRNYVPKFLAAAHVGENLPKYKFKISQNQSYPDVESVEIPGGTNLASVSKLVGIEFAELKKINLSLKRLRTPNWVKSYSIWLPPKLAKSSSKTLMAKLSKVRSWGRISSIPRIHKVRRGDTLSKISRKYKISINRLKRLNKLRNSKIILGQRLIIKSTKYKKVLGRKFYFVKRNDYLGRIAKKFGVRLSYLKKLNGLHSNNIHIGQKLDVTKGIRKFKYRVKRGDNLYLIAKLYQTSVGRIRSKNKLRSSRIFTGQVLSI